MFYVTCFMKADCAFARVKILSIYSRNEGKTLGEINFVE